MARKPVIRTLPSLRSVHPQFQGFEPRQNVAGNVLRLLRDTIERVRGPKSTAFYSIREVAAFFGVSFTTVAVAYQRLQAEGLLTRLRGNQTLMQGRKPTPRQPVRGVVGIPVYLPSLVFGTEVRAFLMTLEAELRRRYFVADFIFYRDGEELASHDMAERLLQHHLDVLLWVVPPEEVIPALLRLKDRGVAIVLVNDSKVGYAQAPYRFDRERALEACLNEWRRAGIRDVRLFRVAGREAQQELQVVSACARRCGLPCLARELTEAEAPTQLRACLRRPATGVILTQHRWYDQLCDKFPALMERLFRRRRVLLTQGAPVHGYFHGKAVYADVITIDPLPMAKRIARDISDGRIESIHPLATFSAAWLPRTNLGQLSHDI